MLLTFFADKGFSTQVSRWEDGGGKKDVLFQQNGVGLFAHDDSPLYGDTTRMDGYNETVSLTLLKQTHEMEKARQPRSWIDRTRLRLIGQAT